MGHLEKEAEKKKIEIEELTQVFGRKLFSIMKKETQSIWRPFYWKQFLMLSFGKNEVLRNKMLGFVSGYSSLKTSKEKISYFENCFLCQPQSPPFIFKLISFFGKVFFTRAVVVWVMDLAIKEIAKHFIVGTSKKEILKAMAKLEKGGASYNLDILGEAASDQGAVEKYFQSYLSLIEIADAEVSLKPSGLCPDFSYVKNLEILKARLDRIFSESRAGVTVDIEQYLHRDLFFTIFREVLHRHDFVNFEGAGIAFQTYLRDWQESLKNLVSGILKEGRPVKIRLVKGAYWDSEVENAKKEGQEPPVFTEKWQTDVAFESACNYLMRIAMIQENKIKIAVASHNVRSVAKVMALARAYNFPKEKLEFQVLYGMGYPLMKAIIRMGYPVKVYVPIGEVVKGMAYLVRRIIENTSQTSFVFQSFSGDVSVEELLKNPAENLKP